MAVIDVDTVKIFLQISGTSKDDLIEALIPEVEADIRSYCNRSFIDTTGADDWPDGMKKIAADMICFEMDTGRGLKSESQGGYSYTRADIGESGYPTSIEKKLSSHKFVSGKFGQPMQSFRDRRGMGLEDLSKGNAWHGNEGYPV